MAQTIIFPEAVNFERNPMVVNFKTTSSTRTFLKAVMESVLSKKAANGFITVVREERYSIPLDYSINTPVKFDLHTLAQMADPQYSISPMENTGIITRDTVQISSKLYEEYLLDGETLYDPPLNSSFPESTNYKQFIAIPGGLTDYERMTLNKTLVELIGSVRILSRKPDGEIIHPDSYYVIPGVTKLSSPTNSYMEINNGITYGSVSTQLDDYRCFVYRQKISNVLNTIPGAKTIRVSISGKNGPLGYIGKKAIAPYHFHFINGFGLIESITCYAREKKTVAIETQESVFIPERNLKNVVSSFTTKSDTSESYLLNTGIINREWAEWFIHEFFTTNEAYMEVNGKWIPVSIIPDNKITSYDLTKPNLISLDFTVKPQFSGSLNNNFVQ